MATDVCSVCKAPATPGATFCFECGGALQSHVTPPSRPANGKPAPSTPTSAQKARSRLQRAPVPTAPPPSQPPASQPTLRQPLPRQPGPPTPPGTPDPTTGAQLLAPNQRVVRAPGVSTPSTTPPTYPLPPSINRGSLRPRRPFTGAPGENQNARRALKFTIIGMFLFGTTSVIGVVLGLWALREIAASNGVQTGRGKAIFAVVVGMLTLLSVVPYWLSR